MNTVPYIPFWHLYELKNTGRNRNLTETKLSTAKRLEQEDRASCELTMPWTHHMNRGFTTLKDLFDRWKGVPSLITKLIKSSLPLNKNSSLSVQIHRSQGSAEPFGTWIVAIHYIKEAVSHRKANVCIYWKHLDHPWIISLISKI